MAAMTSLDEKTNNISHIQTQMFENSKTRENKTALLMQHKRFKQSWRIVLKTNKSSGVVIVVMFISSLIFPSWRPISSKSNNWSEVYNSMLRTYELKLIQPTSGIVNVSCCYCCDWSSNVPFSLSTVLLSGGESVSLILTLVLWDVFAVN